MTHAAELAKALKACADLYGAEFTDRQAVLYADVLKGYEIGRLRSAIRAHIQHPSRGRFFPKPADLIAALPDLTPSERLPSKAPALERKPRPSEQTIRARIAYFDRRAGDEDLSAHHRKLARLCGDWWRDQLHEGETAA